MMSAVPAVPGPAVARGGRLGNVPGEATALLQPFVAGRAPELRRVPAPPPVVDSMNQVADRLERIAASLRNTSKAGILLDDREGRDALELLITAFALGFHEGRIRAPAVDPAPPSA